MHKNMQILTEKIVSKALPYDSKVSSSDFFSDEEKRILSGEQGTI